MVKHQGSKINNSKLLKRKHMLNFEKGDVLTYELIVIIDNQDSKTAP